MSKNKTNTIAIDLKQSLEGVTQWVVLYFLLVFPLLPGTDHVYQNITFSKFMYFAVAVAIYIAAVIFVIYRAYSKDNNILKTFLDTKDENGNIKKWKPSIPQILIICYMLWSLVSAIASKYPFSETIIGQSRYEALLSIWLYGILFLLVSQFGKHSDVYIYGMMVMAFILGLICFVQAFGVKLLFPSEGDYTYFNTAFLGTIGHHDCYSNIVSLIIPALFCGFVFTEKKFRWIALPGIFMLFYVQIFSDVDCGKIGLLAAYIVALPFLVDSAKNLLRSMQALSIMVLAYSTVCLFGDTNWSKLAYSNIDTVKQSIVPHVTKKFVVLLVLSIILFAIGILAEKYYQKNKKTFKLSSKTIRITVVCILVVCIIAGLIYVYKYDGEKKLIKEASMLLHGELTDGMGTNRGYIWKATFGIIKEHPLMGIGPGVYTYETVARDIHFSSETIDQAHNDFIQIITCQGLIGLAIYLAFTVTLLVRGFKKATLDNRSRLYTFALVGFLGAVTFVFSIAIVSPVYWVFAGLLEHLSLEGKI